jgi:hypothetical protein
MRQLIQNSIVTPDGTKLISRSRHDYITHLDKNGETYMVDGGLDYERRSVNQIQAKETSIYSDDPFELIRENLYRGGRGKNGDEPLKYVVLSEIDNEWLDAIINYEQEHRPNNFYLKYYIQEKEYRKNNNYEVY